MLLKATTCPSCPVHESDCPAADVPPFPSLSSKQGSSISPLLAICSCCSFSLLLPALHGLSEQAGVQASDEVGLGPSITLSLEESTSCLA